MSVKLITSDAKGLFQKFLLEFGNCYENCAHTKKEAAFALQMRQQAGFIRRLSNWFFDESNISPKIIKPDGSGDWNGQKIANIKIKGKLFLFKNALFDVTVYTDEEAKFLISKKYQALRSEIDFLKSRSDESSSKSKTRREPIPERIRNEVWRRDGGKCVECGSVYHLEFDHMIPVSEGGANTARNLQLLCEPCNRRKSNKIG